MKDLKYFLLFTGFPRSGHTLVAAILNANPNVICSNQLNILNNLKKYKNKDELLQYIKEYSIKPETWKNTTQISHVQKKEITVIGDKAAHRTTVSLGDNPRLLGEFKEFIKIPIKWIHVVRHPSDNLATWSRLNHENKLTNRKKSVLKKEIDSIIKKYTLLNETIVRLKRSENMLTIHHEDVITKMHNTLEEICHFLEISFDPIWRDNVRNSTWKKPRITRNQVPWTPTQKAYVNGLIQKYDWLKEYKNFGGCGRCN